MPAPIRIVHDTNPRDDIMNDVYALLKNVRIPPYGVLLVMYERGAQKAGKEATTKGGIIIPQQQTGTLREDTFQGKVGLVIKLGALAFSNDATHNWDNFKPAPGEWVAISVGDTYSFDLPGPRRCRIADDANIRMIVPDDVFDAIW